MAGSTPGAAAEVVSIGMRASSDPPAGGGEGRSGKDRRRHRLPRLKFLLNGGRRRRLRRREDRYRIALFDQYSPRLFAVILTVLALSLIDAVLTLFLLEHGAYEMNPVMARLLAEGPLAFIVGKYLLTCLALGIFLIVYPGRSRALDVSYRSLFVFSLAAFGGVILWEVALMAAVFNR
jgi:hypothetical protein